MNHKETAQAALQLLERVDLKGAEVGVFLNVNQMLGEIAQETLIVCTCAEEPCPPPKTAELEAG